MAAVASLPALDWHAGQDQAALLAHNRALSARIIEGVDALGLALASPRDAGARGGSVMLRPAGGPAGGRCSCRAAGARRDRRCARQHPAAVARFHDHGRGGGATAGGAGRGSGEALTCARRGRAAKPDGRCEKGRRRCSAHLWSRRPRTGSTRAAVQVLDDARLPAGEVTVAVEYSTLNYKDGLCLRLRRRAGADLAACAGHRLCRHGRGRRTMPRYTPGRPGGADRLARGRGALGRLCRKGAGQGGLAGAAARRA